MAAPPSGRPACTDELELTDEQRRVYAALNDREARLGPARPDEVAHDCGLDLATTRKVLRQLVSDEMDLVRELSPESPNLGPRYEVKDRV